MQVKSSNLPNAGFIDGILAISELLKDKEKLSALKQDIAAFNELYQSCMKEKDFISSEKAKIDLDLEFIKKEKKQNEEDKENNYKKNSYLVSLEEKIKEEEKQLESKKAQFESEYLVKLEGVEAMRNAAKKEREELEAEKQKALSTVAEYEEKLSKLKEMVK